MQAAYYCIVVLLAVVAVVCLGFAIHAIQNPRRVWDRQHGRDVQNGEPTADSLIRIRRKAWIGLILSPIMLVFGVVVPEKLPGPDANRIGVIGFDRDGNPLTTQITTGVIPVGGAAAAQVRLEPIGQIAVVGDDPFVSLAVQDKTAYLIQGNVEKGKRLRVVDLSDPSQPRVVGSCELTVEAGALAVSGQHVYVLDEPHLRVIDVSDPARPHPVGSCELGELLWAVAIHGQFAFITDVTSVRVVDLSEPTAPKEIGRCEVESALGITLAGQYAYVCCDVEGLHILDISDPKTLKEVGVFEQSGGANEVAVKGQHAYIAGGEDAVTLWIVDVSDPKHPKGIGRYGDWIVGSVALLDDLAFIAGGDLDIVDISNPAAPKPAGSHRNVEHIAVIGRDVYILGGAGFEILRVVRDSK